ncbi:1-(5-phosphoribosyl)-5-[(5-phosphoribosylamino)methylideneamino]imidazole-4-carboxamide isomerase [Marilutibacter spongiae]|uniref:1-(5-phosphoribosyl)-5-[(5-phosphoribosylamino)methylideneamino] imidazole-4-carboxamide isomerase n=1 Tax=Marilutibacter spongiae TaxID=2025720 RepID=A0A7W3Y606_9GAMM|nr:1-(5-phosphoribosyl)-5-[(5-phosphoribosylamino)methylideneamino]imidazole-4-carboxamide isomerase [Lysobacter spongiae]MBB1060540.1 1-(5-phosphoribosyl)-5-[(5-phosphoribosylamino)methylideneamino]imidazole-4-carboxamide isomerase [Lysobacter spongiae]
MSAFTVLPAIDVREGRVVRLHQGDFARETRYPVEPLAAARNYAEAGAQWLHLVDLDAARNGGFGLAALVDSIKACTSLKVQTGGGVRRAADVQAILDAGADRVVVGSLAVREPQRVIEWATAHGAERLTVALDTRRDADGQWRLPVAGWTERSELTLAELLGIYSTAGIRHLLCTDIDRDGTLAGPNLALYREVLALAPRLRLQASGGIRDLADIQAARESGCAGAVLGKALLEGHFELADALELEAPAC